MINVPAPGVWAQVFYCLFSVKVTANTDFVAKNLVKCYNID